MLKVLLYKMKNLGILKTRFVMCSLRKFHCYKILNSIFIHSHSQSIITFSQHLYLSQILLTILVLENHILHALFDASFLVITVFLDSQNKMVDNHRALYKWSHPDSKYHSSSNEEYKFKKLIFTKSELAQPWTLSD